ncbi:hypothetical protein EVAR_46304_1 [Eumeta japonica]|uniref:Uncharacterized protein n=1 Tax=Eumeta variegata TaxID=151549 RepID=A0A4C1XW17_EUMVA|nr:hypothetical protein EVAR_46304_1 [Eumeta japonica]
MVYALTHPKQILSTFSERLKMCARLHGGGFTHLVDYDVSLIDEKSGGTHFAYNQKLITITRAKQTFPANALEQRNSNESKTSRYEGREREGSVPQKEKRNPYRITLLYVRLSVCQDTFSRERVKDKNESRINTVEMRFLRDICEVFLKDRCRNSDVRVRCGLKEDVVSRVVKGSLRVCSVFGCVHGCGRPQRHSPHFCNGPQIDQNYRRRALRTPHFDSDVMQRGPGSWPVVMILCQFVNFVPLKSAGLENGPKDEFTHKRQISCRLDVNSPFRTSGVQRDGNSERVARPGSAVVNISSLSF